MLKAFTRKQPAELVPAPEPAKPPTQMEQARAALVSAQELVANLTSRAAECSAMVRALPIIDPKIPIEDRIESETRAAIAKSIAERIARELNDARAQVHQREQELERVNADSHQVQAMVRYRQNRLEPHVKHADDLRTILQALPTNLQAIAYALPSVASSLLQAQNDLEIELHHTIPLLQRELEAAQAEAARIGV